jgi:hypothetical protein
MKFDVKKWRIIYEKIHLLTLILKDANVRLNDRLEWDDPLHEISRRSRKSIESEIKELIVECKICLDDGGMISNPVLLHYQKEDESTWPSSPSFKFQHLMKPALKKCSILLK